MTCTRERKERFIRSFPHRFGNLHDRTDDAIDRIVESLIWSERLRIKIINENRALARQSEQRGVAA